MNPSINIEMEPSPEIQHIGGAIIPVAGLADETGAVFADENGTIIQPN